MKQDWKPGTMIYPLPALLVSCGSTEEEYNIITVAWQVLFVPTPHVLYIRASGTPFLPHSKTEYGIRHQPHHRRAGTRYGLVRRTFRPRPRQIRETGLTPAPATVVKAPVVAEAPLSIECRVRQILPLGSHDLFLAEVVNIQADSRYIDPETGKLELQKARPIVYSHGEYFALGRMLGYFGCRSAAKRESNGSDNPTK